MSFWEKVKKTLIGEPTAEADKPASAAERETQGGGADTPWSSGTAEQAAGAKDAAGGSAPEGNYKRVKVNPGANGWGGPLIVEPKPGKDLIYSVTGGGIHPVAQRIADLSGGTPFDGFNSNASFDQIACAIIDCGGTARVGVYPMKKVPTIDIYPTSPSGPLMKFITEDIFVSGVGENSIEVIE